MKVAEFSSLNELRAHYARLRAQTYAPKLISPRERSAEIIDVSSRHFDPHKRSVSPQQDPKPKPAALTRDILRLATRDILMPQGPRHRAKMIRKDVAQAHGVTLGEMDGPRRERRIVNARHEAMARVYVECPELSLPEIGRMFGGRDHTTALWAVKRMGVHRQDHIEKRG